MRKNFWDENALDISRPRTLFYAAVWVSAGLVGGLAVVYARLISSLQADFFRYFEKYPYVVTAVSPFLFLLATWLVRKFAPDAKGSGIPQVLAAIEQARVAPTAESGWQSQLVSLRTAVIKILSSAVGILGGASIGREGPTVQIAASAFTWIGHRIKRLAPAEVDLQSFLIAGGAAGVSAAFNTPLAGIAFALEEIADGMFGPFRQIVMLAVIIAGVVSQGLNGNYLYFGDPTVRTSSVPLLLPEVLMIGLFGGLAGGCFAKILMRPEVTRLPKHWISRALVTGFLCSAITLWTAGKTAGSGYEFAKNILESTSPEKADLTFPFLKFVSTILSFLSGMAGGIFSPSLSIGAGLGVVIAKIAHFSNFKACALMGMVAFFSGAIGAPLTGVIIVMEMTNEHILVLPFLIAAYLAYSAGKRISPEPLYHFLARKHLEG